MKGWLASTPGRRRDWSRSLRAGGRRRVLVRHPRADRGRDWGGRPLGPRRRCHERHGADAHPAIRIPAGPWCSPSARWKSSAPNSSRLRGHPRRPARRQYRRQDLAVSELDQARGGLDVQTDVVSVVNCTSDGFDVAFFAREVTVQNTIFSNIGRLVDSGDITVSASLLWKSRPSCPMATPWRATGSSGAVVSLGSASGRAQWGKVAERAAKRGVGSA